MFQALARLSDNAMYRLIIPRGLQDAKKTVTCSGFLNFNGHHVKNKKLIIGYRATRSLSTFFFPMLTNAFWIFWVFWPHIHSFCSNTSFESHRVQHWENPLSFETLAAHALVSIWLGNYEANGLFNSFLVASPVEVSLWHCSCVLLLQHKVSFLFAPSHVKPRLQQLVSSL